jgi:8-oxo-dGTP pyrophosphatase MutT (NUDIX family)
MYKVFYNKKSIIFTGTPPEHHLNADDTVLFYPEHPHDTGGLHSARLNGEQNNFYVICTEPVATRDHFLEHMRPIFAGGGVVTNPKGETLVILRHGFWDLPKGKQDPPETIANCALRETEEETGTKPSLVSEPPLKTLHIYEKEGVEWIKHTTWFRMTAPDTIPVPQRKENITDAKWVDRQFLRREVFKHSYPLIDEVLQHYRLI